MLLRAAVVLLALLAPAAAQAQFAGVPTPPPRRDAAPLLTPAQVDSVRDSVRRDAMSDMRAWVDSAAGLVTVTPGTPRPPERERAPASDTAAAPARPARPPRR